MIDKFLCPEASRKNKTNNNNTTKYGNWSSSWNKQADHRRSAPGYGK
jgi:hypothetical protein